MGWTCGKNGRGTIDKESVCAWSRGYKEKRKTDTEMEHCAKRDLVGVGGEWRMRAMHRGE